MKVVIGAEVLIDVSNSFASTTYDDWATANGSCPCAG